MMRRTLYKIIILLFVSSVGLFAQITNIVPTEFLVKSANGTDMLMPTTEVQGGIEDTLNPLINRMVLDNILIVEAGAGTTIRALGPTGGDFSVIIHDSVTAVAHDSALAVTDNDITSVWVDEDGALQVATTGFPQEPSGGEDSTIIQIASVGAASGSIVWVNTHYDHKKDRLIDLHEFIEEFKHYSIHSGFEIAEGTASNLGFNFGAGGTENNMHSVHGWRAAHDDAENLTFIDDIFSGGSGTTFGNAVYGNNVSMTNNYYSKFRLWIVTNNAGMNEFHITRATEEWGDVAHAEAAGWPALPAGYGSNQIDLIGVVYKKGKTWDNLDGVKDWIITNFTEAGVLSSGGAVGLGPEDVGGIVSDSLQGITNALSLDLPYYFSRNVVQLMASSRDAADDYADWANLKWDDAAAGVHSDNTTNYLTDWQSITLTDNSDDDGIHLDFTNKNLTQTADGDTSVMADYMNWNIYILTQDIADLNDTDGLGIILACDAQGTLTNYFYYLIDDSELSNGWNYFKVAKSAFTGVGAAVGDSMWNTITGVSLYLDGTPDAEVIVSIDNLQMVRDDPDAAEPNPFQSETTDGTWVADWTEEGNGNIWIVEESGVLGATSAGGLSASYLNSVVSFGDWQASGSGLPASSGTLGILWFAGGESISIGSNLLELKGATDDLTTTFNLSAGEMVYWKAQHKGTSISVQASKDGLNWTSLSNDWTAGVGVLRLYLYGRRHSFGFSTVAYAAEAGVAYRVEYLFYRNDTLFVKHAGTTGDSLAAIVPDVILKE